MDPFSLSVGIAGLAGLAATTVSVAKSYVSGVKNAKGSATELVTELEALHSNLSSLDEFLRSGSAKGLTFQRTSVLWSCASACEGKLKSLCKKLGQVGESRTSRYLWPLNEREYQKTVQELRAFAQWMQFALAVDGCSLLSRTSDDVLKILEQQLESFRTLQALEDKTTQLQDAVRDQTRVLQDDRNAKTREHILNWISKLEHDQKHHTVRSPRVEGTGRWLLEQLEYVQWRDDVSASNVLWCHGVQGSGKTVLTSLIIDELKSSFPGPKSPVAFFYFDYQDQDHQTPSTILSTILRQIVAAMPDIPNSVTDAYEKLHGSGVSLPLHELEKLMLDITRRIQRTYIIIDALDECDESKYRRTFLQFIDRLKQIQTVRLFVTSRQYPQDIYAAFHTYTQIEIQAHDSDLRRYMYQELARAGVDDIVDDIFATKIVETVINRAQGMFLLPILQLRTVLKEPTAGEMEDALASLSRNLPEAFEETTTRIQRLPESRRRLGISILMWICHAKRALTVSELSDALSVKLGQAAMSPKHRPSPKMMVECCQGLVTIDPETMSIRLAHYAIQEYLIGHSNKLFLCAEAKIGAICLTYLLFDTFRQGPCLDEDAIESRIESNPFLSYASSYWGVHVQRSETDQNVQRLTFAFLSSRSAVACANQIIQYNNLYREEYWNSEECYSTTALHVASHFGLENILHKLLDEGIFPVDAATKMGSTALITSRGHISIVRMLLQRGANPYLKNWYGNALHCAAEAGYSGTIYELIRHGMSANACQYYDRIPIHCTLDNDQAAAFETLITLGADIDARDEGGVSVFHRAAQFDCVNIMDLILQRRWADLESKTPGGLKAIHFAATGSNTAILLRLLEAGGDINAQDNKGRTPLHHAIHCGNKDSVSLLLERGADVKIRTHEGESALQIANVLASDRETEPDFSYADPST